MAKYKPVSEFGGFEMDISETSKKTTKSNEQEFGAVEIEGVKSPRGVVSDVGVQLGKGVAEGAIGLPADVLSILRNLKQRYLIPEQHRKTPQELQEQRPLPTSSSINRGLESLGIDPEAHTAPGRYAERGGRAFGSALATSLNPAFALSMVPSAMVGQSVEEALGPGWGLAAELAAGGVTGAVRKGVSVAASQRPFVSSLKRLKIPAEDIALLTKSPGATAALSKFATKAGEESKAAARLKALDDNVDKAYGFIRKKGASLGPGTRNEQTKVLRGLSKLEKEIGRTLPDSQRAKAIKTIGDIAEDVSQKGIDVPGAMDYWQEINDSVNWNASKSGKKALGKVKGVLGDFMDSKSQTLFEDYKALNKAKQRSLRLEKGLTTKNWMDTAITVAEAYPLVKNLFFMNPKAAAVGAGGLLAAKGAQKGAQALVLSSRTQGMFRKYLQAVQKNKLHKAARIAQELERELEKEQANREAP